MSKPIILAIETSCDETGVAITRQTNSHIEVLAEVVASQIDIHKLTGGVVPEAAAREHVSVIKPLLEKVLEDSGIDKDQINGIAITIGPGLQPALSVGVTTAQTLAFAWQKPIVPIHHLEGHIYAALLSSTTDAEFSIFNFQFSNDEIFPALALIVSGGHTMLVLMKRHLQYQIIGSTRDDAAGEAFDKVARMLDLSYPGGPKISRLAEQGNPAAFKFARPMLHSGDFDFSFSGLKTEVLYTLRDLSAEQLTASLKSDVAASFQQAVIDTLVSKTIKAANKYKPHTLILTGGVAANKNLRRQLTEAADTINTPLLTSPLHLCGDNATMIALAGHIALTKNRTSHWRDIDSHARLNLADFSSAN